MLELSAYDRGKDPERVVRAFAPLSDALAIACWERVLGVEGVGREGYAVWPPRLAERPGSGTAMARLIRAWERRKEGIYGEHRFAEVARLPAEVGARVFGELLAAMRELEREDREGRLTRDERFLRQHVANTAARLAPDEGDARDLLVTILGGPIETAASDSGGRGPLRRLEALGCPGGLAPRPEAPRRADARAPGRPAGEVEAAASEGVGRPRAGSGAAREDAPAARRRRLVRALHRPARAPRPPARTGRGRDRGGDGAALLPAPRAEAPALLPRLGAPAGTPRPRAGQAEPRGSDRGLGAHAGRGADRRDVARRPRAPGRRDEGGGSGAQAGVHGRTGPGPAG